MPQIENEKFQIESLAALTANLHRWRWHRHRHNAGNFPNHDAALASPQPRRQQQRPRDFFGCCCCCSDHISQPARVAGAKLMMLLLLLWLSVQQLHVGLFCPHFCGCCCQLLHPLHPLQLLNLNCCCFGWKYSNCFSVNGEQTNKVKNTDFDALAQLSAVSAGGQSVS